MGGNTMKKKDRGIPYTSEKIAEDLPVTIINRYGQVSIHLPRIDDAKRWAGYPGLTGISRRLAAFIENLNPMTTYCEPFAGAAKVYQALDKKHGKFYRYILNDKSDFIYGWLKSQFTKKNIIVSNLDFGLCILKWDSEKTLFVIDPPWNKSYYLQTFSCFDRNSVKEYDEQVLELCRKLKGKFIITTRRENKIMLNSEFNHKLMTSEYAVSGKYPKVLLTTNLV